jgi:hypothetical protein
MTSKIDDFMKTNWFTAFQKQADPYHDREWELMEGEFEYIREIEVQLAEACFEVAPNVTNQMMLESHRFLYA